MMETCKETYPANFIEINRLQKINGLQGQCFFTSDTQIIEPMTMVPFFLPGENRRTRREI